MTDFLSISSFLKGKNAAVMTSSYVGGSLIRLKRQLIRKTIYSKII